MQTPMTTASERIEAVRTRLGKRLAILGHHYQADAVIRHVDFQGDSLELSRKVDGLAAEHIVFCGVYFMAESAVALARPGQKVHIPDASATCPMAEMAPAQHLADVLDGLRAQGRLVIPLAYVNSSAEVKAICGLYGGSVCTSANARTMLEWALTQGDAVLFLPDKNLGANTANQLGIAKDERLAVDIRSGHQPADPQKAARARLLLWPGCCAIHHMLHTRHVDAMRAAMPGVRVVVHPECSPAVVRAADSAGSTSHIIRYCEQAKPGSAIAVGTEDNLVLRLAGLHKAQGKTIVPLKPGTLCSNMAKITEERLAELLERLETAVPLALPDDVAKQSRVALTRMLDICS
ncbi:quinolinate synthetase [Humidesulfovibrio mexicanus]|uniref:quinolinate synthase n=1 Tax=Humidesulfovibrio mexicanus TaxID=147047 RepID=A0A238XXE1_9BACT|nr:quinolinate synthase NadA [Humidesulfovibrio mexicanus]SNR63181.1 quinolinate synthetase [Humidesulfovibrio mexicanus]